MTREEAEIYAKTMTYEDALYNLSKARAIPYRKATFIKVNELIKALSQEPTSEMVHVETLRQVMWERDIAIEQLHELGYELGQKIEPCDDAISRNQSNACSILDDECPYPHKHCWECPLNYQYELAKHELDKNVDLPSVTQKSGKWICIDDYHIGKFKCSVCQTEGFPNTVMYKPTWNYCPNCGSYNGGDNNGNE